MSDNLPAEVHPPGEFLKEELEARGWSQVDLGEILGRPPRVVNEIIAGKRAITPETARGLADALGTSPELWLNLESSYQLWKLDKRGGRDTTVARKGKLYSKFPLKEMVRRGWMEPSPDLDVVEARLCRYFQIASVDDEPALPHAARKSTSYTLTATPLQLAWLFRARQLAEAIRVNAFSVERLASLVERLRALRADAADLRQVPRVLADAGVRLVIVEALPGGKIDGATVWRTECEPIVALSLRYDRIDSVWHTLLHELAHVKHRDGTRIDVDLDSASDDSAELKANAFAREFLVPQAHLDSFVRRVSPLYSRAKLLEFAARHQVHPGIVAGQLHRRHTEGRPGGLPHSHFRPLLVSIRQYLIESAITDGWGHVPVLGG
jgi:HTH-type transcriptional regulator / antitoxin HigA